MDINLQTKVADLLTAYPQLEEVLIDLSPFFSKLKNPVLRRTVAKVTSLQQAANVAKIPPTELIQKLRIAAGLSVSGIDSIDDGNDNKERPLWADQSKISTRFDARPVIESGNSPMQEILQRASSLKSGEVLFLQASFKPVPIIDILVSKGYEVWADENEVFIHKR